MIDTDKYEEYDNWYLGHYKGTGKHEVRVEGNNEVEDDHVCYLQYHPAFKDVQAKNAKLIADAPLLLAEVKRLREAIADIANNMEAADPSYLQGFIRDLLEVIE
tara:strand:- start:403 stop:714 length:312 start_codon:yes stop_codon:yes gene_type:complete